MVKTAGGWRVVKKDEKERFDKAVKEVVRQRKEQNRKDQLELMKKKHRYNVLKENYKEQQKQQAIENGDVRKKFGRRSTSAADLSKGRSVTRRNTSANLQKGIPSRSTHITNNSKSSEATRSNDDLRKMGVAKPNGHAGVAQSVGKGSSVSDHGESMNESWTFAQLWKDANSIVAINTGETPDEKGTPDVEALGDISTAYASLNQQGRVIPPETESECHQHQRCSRDEVDTDLGKGVGVEGFEGGSDQTSDTFMQPKNESSIKLQRVENEEQSSSVHIKNHNSCVPSSTALATQPEEDGEENPSGLPKSVSINVPSGSDNVKKSLLMEQQRRTLSGTTRHTTSTSSMFSTESSMRMMGDALQRRSPTATGEEHTEGGASERQRRGIPNNNGDGDSRQNEFSNSNKSMNSASSEQSKHLSNPEDMAHSAAIRRYMQSDLSHSGDSTRQASEPLIDTKRSKLIKNLRVALIEKPPLKKREKMTKAASIDSSNHDLRSSVFTNVAVCEDYEADAKNHPPQRSHQPNEVSRRRSGNESVGGRENSNRSSISGASGRANSYLSSISGASGRENSNRSSISGAGETSVSKRRYLRRGSKASTTDSVTSKGNESTSSSPSLLFKRGKIAMTKRFSKSFKNPKKGVRLNGAADDCEDKKEDTDVFPTSVVFASNDRKKPTQTPKPPLEKISSIQSFHTAEEGIGFDDDRGELEGGANYLQSNRFYDDISYSKRLALRLENCGHDDEEILPLPPLHEGIPSTSDHHPHLAQGTVAHDCDSSYANSACSLHSHFLHPYSFMHMQPSELFPDSPGWECDECHRQTFDLKLKAFVSTEENFVLCDRCFSGASTRI